MGAGIDLLGLIERGVSEDQGMVLSYRFMEEVTQTQEEKSLS